MCHQKGEISLENDLLIWWTNSRHFFEEHAPAILPQLENEAVRLHKLVQQDSSFCVCVLGQSAVGKSTLLNAIVAKDNTILPAGGLGPLTALATEVRYNDDPYFLVTYRDKKQLSGFRLQIERELKRQGLSDETASVDETEALDEESTLLVLDEHEDGPTGKNRTSTVFAELSKQVSQLITGDQFQTLPLNSVLHGFRAILGIKGSDVSSFSDDDQQRIRAAARIVASQTAGEPTRFDKGKHLADFDQLLHDHVSGHLALCVYDG